MPTTPTRPRCVAALDALAAMPARRRVAVLGLMAEIEDPPAGHRLVAAHAARLGIEVMAVAVDLVRRHARGEPDPRPRIARAR